MEGEVSCPAGAGRSRPHARSSAARVWRSTACRPLWSRDRAWRSKAPSSSCRHVDAGGAYRRIQRRGPHTDRRPCAGTDRGHAWRRSVSGHSPAMAPRCQARAQPPARRRKTDRAGRPTTPLWPDSVLPFERTSSSRIAVPAGLAKMAAQLPTNLRTRYREIVSARLEAAGGRKPAVLFILGRPEIRLVASRASYSVSSGCRDAENISQLTMNIAAISGPRTKPLRPKTAIPPIVETSTT